jgi:GT2 family glycosyltransferase
MVPQVSIVVVSFNTREMTLECLRSVLAETTVPFELIVVDNASTDGSADAIAEELPTVTLKRERENHGFGKANNLAAEIAEADYLLLLNPDTIVVDRAIDRLLAFAKDRPEGLIWGGRTIFKDGSLNPTSCWRFVSLWSLFCAATGLSALFRGSRVFNAEGYGGWQRDTIKEVDIVTGCFLMIRKDLWDKLGGFDETFFMYAEEADLCFRARQNGARPLITPEATIVHYGGASEVSRAGKTIKLFSGKVTFLRKHWHPYKYKVGVGLFKLIAITRLFGYSVLSRIKPSDRSIQAAESWRAVWSARGDWMAGYESTGG